jgi:hypothetical protein
MSSEELKKEWEREFDNEFPNERYSDTLMSKVTSVSRIKSFISSLLAKQQEMTNSEWVAYGKKMGYHDYWKDMTRIALQEEFVKCLPEYAKPIDKLEEVDERARMTNLLNENMVIGYNQCIADIKSKLK